MTEKKKVKIMNPKFGLNSIGRAIVSGTCPNGHKVTKILKKEEIPPDLLAKMKKPVARGSGRGGKHSSGRKSGGRKSGRKSGHKRGKRSSGRKRRSAHRRK